MDEGSSAEVDEGSILCWGGVWVMYTNTLFILTKKFQICFLTKNFSGQFILKKNVWTLVLECFRSSREPTNFFVVYKNLKKKKKIFFNDYFFYFASNLSPIRQSEKKYFNCVYIYIYILNELCIYICILKLKRETES
jgi:hypothetical protein